MTRDSARVQLIMPPDVQLFPRAPSSPKSPSTEQHDDDFKNTNDPENGNEEPEPAAVPAISLHRVLLDCYEFQGLKEMLHFVLFFSSIVAFVWMQWSQTGAVFRSTIVESVRSWDPGDDWQSSQLKSVDSVEDALDYYTGYLQSLSNKTAADGIANSTLWIGEYVEVSHVRLVVNWAPACKRKRFKSAGWEAKQRGDMLEECFASARDGKNGEDERQRVERFRGSERWKLLELADPEEPEQHWIWYTTLFSKNQETWEKWGLIGENPMVERLNIIAAEDRGVLGTYGGSLSVEMLGVSRIGRDAVYVKVETGISSWRNGYKLLTRQLVLTVNTLRPKGASASMSFWVMLVACIICGVFCVVLLRREAGVARLCGLQSGSPWVYFKYRWNVLQFLGLLFCLGFLLSFFYIMSQKSYGYSDLVFDMTDREFEDLHREADRYTLWLYFGLFLMGWEGMCMLRFMRVHGGLKTFYQVFTEAFKWLADFLVFVAYVFLVLGLLVFGAFQISGGNPLFVEYGTGVSAMARLQFQLLSFDEFTLGYLGFGSQGGMVIELLFWATVVLLVVFVANILLAIFTGAYDSARRKSLESDGSFLGMVFRRMWFTCVQLALDYAWYPFLHWVVEQRVNMQYNEDDVRVNPNAQLRTYFEMLLDESKHPQPIKDRKWDLLQARWLLAERFPLQTIVAFYTDFTTLKLLRPSQRPEWLVLSQPERSKSGRKMRTHITRERFKRAVPEIQEEMTEAEFRRLLEFLLEVQHLVRAPDYLRLFAGSHQFHVMKTEMVNKIVEDVMRVYQYVPKPKRDYNNDGVDDDEDDPLVLLKGVRDQVDALTDANKELQAQLAQVVTTLNQLATSQESLPGAWARDV